MTTSHVTKKGGKGTRSVGATLPKRKNWGKAAGTKKKKTERGVKKSSRGGEVNQVRQEPKKARAGQSSTRVAVTRARGVRKKGK